MSDGYTFDFAGSRVAVVIAAALLAPASLHAQEGEAAPVEEIPPGQAEPEDPIGFDAEEEAGQVFNTGNISLSGGFDVVSTYWFRGIAQENQGAIVQPFLDVSFGLTENVSVYVGTWNSLHENSSDPWFEADWYAGLSLALPANFGLDVSYINLYGPSSGDSFAEEIDISLGYDDSEALGDFALSPYATFVIETEAGSDGLGTGGEEGMYLELGVEPGFTLIDSEDYPIALSIPVTVGLDIDDYYENAAGEDGTFGFVDVGLIASTPLEFMPSEYGAWSLSAGVHGIFLGDGAREISHNDFNVVSDDDFQIWGSVGIAFEY